MTTFIHKTDNNPFIDFFLFSDFNKDEGITEILLI